MSICSYEEANSFEERKEAVETCEVAHDHRETVEELESEMPEEELLYDLAELFKVFGDSTRIKKSCMRCASPRCACAILRSCCT